MAGLDDWLMLLADRLDEALRTALPSMRTWVVIGRDGDGEPRQAGILLTLAALHPAPPARRPPPRRPAGEAAAPAPLVLDADLMVTARRGPGGYAEALRALSLALRWLHANPLLAAAAGETHVHLPGALAIEPVDLPLDQVPALIAAYPTDGMPFALYRLRGMVMEAW